MYEKIAPFVENDVFRSFECFNFATLELFKMLDIATFNIMNWTVDNFKNWTKAYRSYCAMHFETYAGNEMTAGDLLDWWETHQTDLINVMDFILVGNHPDSMIFAGNDVTFIKFGSLEYACFFHNLLNSEMM